MKDRIKISLPQFPNSLDDPFIKTSDPSKFYNCIAWSISDNSRWWWPDEDSYWPEEIQKEESIDAFIDLYNSLGFEVCNNSEPEEGFEKILLFHNDLDEPTHAARQLPNGYCTSKLGENIDVEHSLNSMLNGFYGNNILSFKRKLK